MEIWKKICWILFLIVVYFHISFLSVFIHELGHGLICELWGGGIKKLHGNVAECNEDLSGYALIICLFSGGIFASIVLIIILSVLTSRRNNPWRYHGIQLLSPMIFMQILNALLEGLANDHYRLLINDSFLVKGIELIPFSILLFFNNENLFNEVGTFLNKKSKWKDILAFIISIAITWVFFYIYFF